MKIEMATRREALKDVRISKGLSQAQIASRAGLSRSHYTNIETGARKPSLSVMQAICKALGVDNTIKLF
jgi:transcriptional regulator with XRE-family HTH domain